MWHCIVKPFVKRCRYRKVSCIGFKVNLKADQKWIFIVSFVGYVQIILWINRGEGVFNPDTSVGMFIEIDNDETKVL